MEEMCFRAAMKKAETACSDIMEEEGSSSQQNSSNFSQIRILNKTNNRENSTSGSEEKSNKVWFIIVFHFVFTGFSKMFVSSLPNVIDAQ